MNDADGDATWIDGEAPTHEAALGYPDVAPFVIEGPLGQGGMSTVYRGRDPSGALVAIKILSDVSAKSRLRFLREAEVQIDHENVVKVFGAGYAADETPFFALELLRGETLAERMRREAIDVPDVVDLGLQTAVGLSAVHAQGIIHRDLKPSNLFCCEDGPIKVLDFGVARHHDDLQLTTPGAAIGTPRYMSPEQARGEPTIDERTDIWSLGAVLYEALAGVAPFDRGAPVATLLAAARGIIRPLAEVAPHLPPSLVAVVDRAVAPTPDGRFSSALDFHRALANVSLADEEPTQTRPSPVLAADEERIVVVLFAVGVAEPQRLSDSVVQHGGLFLPLAGHRAIGLFGAKTWHGDEVARAVEAAVSVRSSAAHMAVASGRAARDGDHVAGAALELAIDGASQDIEGVAIDVESARPHVGVLPLRRVSAHHLEVSIQHGRGSTPDIAVMRPMVGRQRERLHLEGQYDDALAARRACLAFIHGVAGIGKSRLAEEVVQSFADRLQVVRGQAASHRRGEVFGLFGDCLKRRFEARSAAAGWPSLRPGVPLIQRRRVVTQFVEEAVGAARASDVAQALGSLLGVDMGDGDVTRPGGHDLRRVVDRVRAGLFDYFEGLTAAGPVLLFADNVDWADAGSRQLCVDLVEQFADRPLLVLAAGRETSALRSLDGAVVMGLDGMSSADARSLAERRAHGSLSDDQLDAIIVRAEGHPAFVEQLVRASIEQQTSADRLALPVSIEGAVQARLDVLEPTDRRLVTQLALLTRPFARHEARAIFEGASDAAFDRLVAGRWLYASNHVMAFASAIVRDVAKSLISDEHRRVLHLRIANEIQRYPHTAPEEIADHLRLAGEPRRAATLYVEAARRAARRGDSEAILRTTALAIESGEATDLADLHLMRAQAFRFLGDGARHAEALEEAVLQASDPLTSAHVASERALLLQRKGKRAESLVEGRRAIDRAKAAGAEALTVLLEGRQVVTLIHDGQLDAAQRLLATITPRLAAQPIDVRARAAGWEGQLFAAQGDHGASRVAFENAVERYREAGDLRLAASAQANLADLDNRFGDARSAARNLRRAADECRRVGHRNMEAYALVNLGYALTNLGRSDAAVTAFRDAALILRTTPDPRLSIYLRLYRLRSALALGNLDGVEAAAGQLAVEAESRQLATPHVGALTIAARAALLSNRATEARRWIESAQAAREAANGIDEDEGEVFAAHVAVLDALLDVSGAAAVALAGAQRLETLATKIRDPEARRRFQEEVPAHKFVLSRASTRS